MLSTIEHPIVAPAQLTTIVSSLHVAKEDLRSIRCNGWLLAHELAPDRIRLSLASDLAPDEFVFQLRERGFSAAFGDLVRWAAGDGICWLVIDDHAEINDRLLIFVD